MSKYYSLHQHKLGGTMRLMVSVLVAGDLLRIRVGSLDIKLILRPYSNPRVFDKM